MRIFLIWILFLFLMFFVCGCWDYKDLPEYGMVQAIGIDVTSDRKVMLTTQIYKPSPRTSSKNGGNKSFVNITTSSDSVFGAINNITSKLGRKALWSHMKVIIVGEKLAKQRDIGDELDFFFRNHEPRLLTKVMVAKGEAKNILNARPLIESTEGQQLSNMQIRTFKYSGASFDANLLSLGQQLRSKTHVGLLPFVQLTTNGRQVEIAGLAIIKNKKLTKTIPMDDSERVLILLNKYRSGIFELPCKTQDKVETVEINHSETRIKTEWGPKDLLTAKVYITLEGNIGSLKCNRIKTDNDMIAFTKNTERFLIEKLKQTIHKLQRVNIDVIGIENLAFRASPEKWRSKKKKIGGLFQQTKFNIKVKLTIAGTGSEIGKQIFE